MKYLLCLLIVILALGIWVGPVRSLKIRHYCNYQAAQYVDKIGNLDAYQTAYTVCVRGR